LRLRHMFAWLCAVGRCDALATTSCR
jgi:hypothetical protein